MRRQLFPPSSASTFTKLDFSAFFNKAFLSDLMVELVCSGSHSSSSVNNSRNEGAGRPFNDNSSSTAQPLSHSVPAHAIILSRASRLLYEWIELTADENETAERSPAGDSNAVSAKHGSLKIPVPSIEGGLLTLEAMYNSSSLVSKDVPPDLLVSVLRIADMLQADVVMLAAAHALQYAAEPANSPASSQSLNNSAWPWSVVSQVLDLPPSLLSSHFCRPLLVRAHERLMAVYADLEAAWTDAELRANFLALPTDAVEFLLSHPDLQVASENTVFVALTDYVERGRGRHAPPEQLAHFGSLLRLQHLSPSFFLSHAITRPWLTRAAGVMERRGGRSLFNNPLFSPSSPSTTPVPNTTAATVASGEQAQQHSDRSSSSDSNSQAAGPSSTLHPIIAAALTRMEQDDSVEHASSEASSDADDAGEPTLPFPPSSAATHAQSGSGGVPPASHPITHTSHANHHMHVGYCVEAGTNGGAALLAGRKANLTAGKASSKSRGSSASASKDKQQLSAVEQELRGALRLCAQYTSFATGQAHTARTAGAVEGGGFLPTCTIHQPPREIPTSSFSSLLDPNARKWDTRAAGTGMLQLEVPLHKLLQELKALGWTPYQAGRSHTHRRVNEMASAGRSTAGTPASAGQQQASGSANSTAGTSRESEIPLLSCTSSCNLVPSPTAVWAGYVWAMDVFVARDPEYVLGLSIHALYPAFGLPPLHSSASDGQGSSSSADLSHPPPSPVDLNGEKHKCAVSAQMLLSVFDVELGRWVALYPKAISTNTGLEHNSSPGFTTSAADRLPIEDKHSIPSQHPHYSVTYTDYYPVWTSMGLNQLVSDPASWQRQAYAPNGRILLRAELVHCA